MYSLNCPVGYSDGGNDICYKVFSTHASYAEATTQCEKDTGHLVSIHNAFVNNFVQQLAEKEGTLVLLGLRCSDSIASHCLWDDGQGAASPYDAFFAGYPSVIGSCVLMMIGGPADGKWISGDCDNMLIGFACQVSMQETCGGFTEYNGECYKAFDALPLTAAESVCVQNCGHVASVHSAAENSMIAKMMGTQADYGMIGLARQTNGLYTWTDQTAFDYNNFGINNTAFGECVSISLVDELVSKEQWITVSCGQALPFVCKRGTESCARTTVASVVTLAPSTCDSPQFYDNNGSFYSPGYPTSYNGTKACIYILTVTPEQDVVQISFADIQLSAGSRMELYNGFVDSVPFVVITTNVPSTTFFTSTTNVMKMIYRAGNQGADRWEAQFSPSVPATTVSTVTITGSPSNPSHCNEVATAPANITSPGYPGNYPALTSCRYQLSTTPENRILLTFGQIDTEQCCDIITVYDYDESPYNPLLDRFSGQIAAGVKVFTSTFNQMFVEFNADSLDQRSGFTATAISTQ